MFSPFALKKIDTQLATLTVVFFLSRVGGKDAKSTWIVLFPCCTRTNFLVSLLYMDQHCGNQGQVKFMIPG